MADDTDQGAEKTSDAAASGQAADGAAATATTATTDQSTTQGQDTGKTDGDGKAAAQGAPEQYADFALPQGTQVDAAMLSEFTPLAKELGLNQESAQKVIDLYAGKVLPQIAAAQQAAMAQQIEDWGKQARDDKDLGGAAFDANVQTAQKAIARFGSPALKELLDTSGFGNHPEVLRFCLSIGKAISEDGVVLGGQAQGSRSLEDVFYGNPKS